jgi:hypothetical protein
VVHGARRADRSGHRRVDSRGIDQVPVFSMRMALRVSDEGPRNAGCLGHKSAAFMQAAQRRHAPLLVTPPVSAWRQIGEETGPCGPMMRPCRYRRPSAAETRTPCRAHPRSSSRSEIRTRGRSHD